MPKVQSDKRRFAATVIFPSIFFCLLFGHTAKVDASPAADVQAVPAADTAPAQAAVTPANLQALYAGEINAQASYLEFAKKADAEGLHKIAALFRASVRSENIRAAHTAKLIIAQGASPEATIAKVAVGSTLQNLETAVKNETDLSKNRLPNFARLAAAEKNTDAAHAFAGTGVIVANRVKLFSAALAKIGAWKTGAVWVCQVCGNVVDKLDFEYCAVCQEPASVYVKIK
jgi:rubrerythrin